MSFKKRARLFVLCLCFLTPSIATGVARASAWPDETIAGGFGVCADPKSTDSEALKKIKAMGFAYIRFDMRWAEVEQRRGEYIWTPFDRFIDDLRERHLKAVVILQGGNPAYAAKVRVNPEDAYGLEWTDPAPFGEEKVRAFAAFAAAAVERYDADNDIIWEIWNEPDVLAFWPPKPNINDFVTLADVTCKAMRAVEPHAVIIGPALAYIPNPYNNYRTDFLNAFLQSPAVACLDAISVHPYRHNDEPPETVKKDYETLRSHIAKYASKPMLIVSSEWGYSMSQVTTGQQAAYALRTLLADVLNGVPLSIWYEWRDSYRDTTPDGKDREAHFGLQDVDGNDKMSAGVLKDILPHLADAHIEKRMAVGGKDLYVLLLRSDSGQHSLLFWRAEGDDRKDAKAVKISVGGKDAIYPTSFIPTLVCTQAVPDVTVVSDAGSHHSSHYIPCAE